MNNGRFFFPAIRYAGLMAVIVFGLFTIIGTGGGGNGGNSTPDHTTAGSSETGDSAEPSSPALPDIVVTTLDDVEAAAPGMVTLRSALSAAQSGQRIVFDQALDGGTIELALVADEHTVLPGEWMEMEVDPDTGVAISVLKGYVDRDYGASALYTTKDVVIDASALPAGLTICCGDAIEARVLAVYGNLTMSNVTITGGRSVASLDIDPDNDSTQTATLARGGGLAVWGLARLSNCTIYDNLCDKSADNHRERDQGAFGGGIYADVVRLTDCVVSGNVVLGSGTSGGGVFTVGGAQHFTQESLLERTAVTGNRLTAPTAYGAGVYSDGGGIGKANTLRLVNCTVAWNVVEGEYSPYGYWRGGGIYMSNGFMEIQSCTIVDNHVSGYWREDLLGKCSLAGGVAATIGLAHAVDSMTIGHSIIAGNTVTDKNDAGRTYDQDIFTGSLMYFKSRGYNRFGVIDFSQMLVPVGEKDWWSLCRKHYPKVGDAGGVRMEDVIDTAAGMGYSPFIFSKGCNEGSPVILSYQPAGTAREQIPADWYLVPEVLAEYEVFRGEDDFLEIFLARVEDHIVGAGSGFAAGFISDFNDYLAGEEYQDPWGNPIETVADIAFFGPAESWVKEPENFPLILFWHAFDDALSGQVPDLGDQLIGDNQWLTLFPAGGPLVENTGIDFEIHESAGGFYLLDIVDQKQTPRAVNGFGDIGAIEIIR
ncbi:MAG: hypothetical protein ACLFPD_01865 [Desulfosudaceae bacterium]